MFFALKSCLPPRTKPGLLGELEDEENGLLKSTKALRCRNADDAFNVLEERGREPRFDVATSNEEVCHLLNNEVEIVEELLKSV